MIDFIAKARKNRIIALNLSTNGTEMFFPADECALPDATANTTRRAVTHVSKPMFVRSQAVQTSAMIQAPHLDAVANDTATQSPQDVFVLTEEFAISEVMRLAA